MIIFSDSGQTEPKFGDHLNISADPLPNRASRKQEVVWLNCFNPNPIILIKAHMRFQLILVLAVMTANVLAQETWSIPRRDREILIDGSLNEWVGVPSIRLSPEVPELRSDGSFTEGDVELLVQGMWDQQYIFIALTWSDDTWDVRDVSRRDAVWIDPENRRRDRMLFFDNVKFHIRRSDYDYTLWLSPSAGGQGPFYWYRLLQGYRGIERATAAPMVHSREEDGRVTLELMLLWRELRLKPGEPFPLTLLLCDSDLPGRLLEAKVDQLKWLAWQGECQFIP